MDSFGGLNIIIIDKKKKKKLGRVWSKRWLLKTQTFSHIQLLEELRLEPDDWWNYLRMDEDTYVELLHLVTPLIERQDTVMRSTITVITVWRYFVLHSAE